MQQRIKFVNIKYENENNSFVLRLAVDGFIYPIHIYKANNKYYATNHSYDNYTMTIMEDDLNDLIIAIVDYFLNSLDNTQSEDIENICKSYLALNVKNYCKENKEDAQNILLDEFCKNLQKDINKENDTILYATSNNHPKTCQNCTFGFKNKNLWYCQGMVDGFPTETKPNFGCAYFIDKVKSKNNQKIIKNN